MSLIFERGGRESTSPTTSSTKEHTLFSYPGNYCTADNPNFDVGGHFTFRSHQDKVIFSVCGGDPYRGAPPKNVSKDDLLHSYVISIRIDSITLQISHQPDAITNLLEATSIELPLNKMIGIRIIGIYLDSQNCRNLYVLMDDESNTDKWKVVATFIDRGQYIPLVSQKIKGMLKSGPPYGSYPYGDNNAITDIHTYGLAEASDTWCRQISSKLLATYLARGMGLIGFKLDDRPPVAAITGDNLGMTKQEQELMNNIVDGMIQPIRIECYLCGVSVGTSLSGRKEKKHWPTLCPECTGRMDSNIRKIKGSQAKSEVRT